ncbi:hypothetical protein KIH75_09235 [Bifidobacterium sp. 64T4]|uniref:hypothetical protein n=1 Tax=Bifidobacterium pongonis TaxID=2834432 RepID=UPI001C572B52|nr:hypothetical protein [Bifidobacterium pongonis]MBW3095506.1 hypothetical protein [Bifidobacterium pongonis]
MRNGKFTIKERAYLSSLPAVKNVSATRIKYEDWFRTECMCRYEAGESPVAIFREAGLDPELIGYKRIERCIARWKKRWRGIKHMTGAQLTESDNALLMSLRENAQAAAGNGMAGNGAAGKPEPQGAKAGLAEAANTQLAISERDLLIARQALRIRELERLVGKFVKQ